MRGQICVSQTLSETNRNEHTKLSASIQAQSVDGAFLASATRCPTSRLEKRLAEKRKAALSANRCSTTQCTPRVAKEDKLKKWQRRRSAPRSAACQLYMLLKIGCCLWVPSDCFLHMLLCHIHNELGIVCGVVTEVVCGSVYRIHKSCPFGDYRIVAIAMVHPQSNKVTQPERVMRDG